MYRVLEAIVLMPRKSSRSNNSNNNYNNNNNAWSLMCAVPGNHYYLGDSSRMHHLLVCNLYLVSFLHCASKNVSTFKLSVTLSDLNRSSKFLHYWKAYEICYKTHLRYFATLPWEIKNLYFLQIVSRYGRKWKQIAFLSAQTFSSQFEFLISQGNVLWVL